LKSFLATRTPSVVTVCQPVLICSRAAKMYNCAIAMAREYVGILTSEEVPGETNVSQSVDEYSVESNVAQLISSRIISCETPSSTAP
jgi:hypothetical protein